MNGSYTMPTSLTATEARVRFGDLLKRVTEQRETVIVERSGEPQVVVLPIPEYQRLLQLDRKQDWGELFQETMILIELDTIGKPALAADDLIHQMREARDAELLDLS